MGHRLVFRFSGEAQKSFFNYLPEQTVLLGTFSKTVAPGFRIGWIVAPEQIREKLLIAKQAADLHTSSVNQYIVYQYLKDNDLDTHLQTIIRAYGSQCREMIEYIRQYLPESIDILQPEGGMFIWGRLPAEQNSMALFEHAVREKVVFVPGDPFYTTTTNTPTFRLNFSCVESTAIEEGVGRLAKAYAAYVS